MSVIEKMDTVIALSEAVSLLERARYRAIDLLSDEQFSSLANARAHVVKQIKDAMLTVPTDRMN